MITLTEVAKEEILKLIEQKNDPEAFVRVGVKGGGCSGLSYSVEIDTNLDEFDKVFGEGKTKVVCDQKSFVYLNGIQIDYSRELVGGGFQFSNPNSKGSCGCGISFSV